jgi:hypothetical protein
MNTQQFIDKIIVHMGDTWRIVGVGAERGGNIFCHMASTHLGRKQKNGWMPAQIGDWVDTEVLKAAK